MQTHYDAELKDTVRYLGKTLGETIKNQLGQEWLDRIEKIRKGGRASYQGDATCSEELKETFKTMSDSDLLTVGRAFAQFLNLGNIAEQEYNAAMNVDASIDALFKHLDKAELTAEKVQDAVAKLNIDLVLTAHPTEVTRRTLIHKHKELANCLQAMLRRWNGCARGVCGQTRRISWSLVSVLVCKLINDYCKYVIRCPTRSMVWSTKLMT